MTKLPPVPKWEDIADKVRVGAIVFALRPGWTADEVRLMQPTKPCRWWNSHQWETIGHGYNPPLDTNSPDFEENAIINLFSPASSELRHCSKCDTIEVVTWR
jgi:hypothetical protein